MEHDLFTLLPWFPRREDLHQCEPTGLDLYLGNLEPYRFRSSALTRSVPNIQQEEITRFLDKHQDEIQEWLDDKLKVNECHKILHVPVYRTSQVFSWKDADLTNHYPIEQRRELLLYIRRCKLQIKAANKVTAYSYAGITDYGHIIVGRLRQESFYNPKKVIIVNE